jgi:ribonuclease VapC
MVLDTSAVVAVLLGEPEFELFNARIQQDERCLISAASVLEATIVLENRKNVPIYVPLDDFLRESQCEIVAVTEDQLAIARDAFRIYGKGRHAAGLNFGDCFSYALAKVTGEPLLFKGNDFIHTDIDAVVLQQH